jgi:DNA repair ATPase RecN
MQVEEDVEIDLLQKLVQDVKLRVKVLEHTFSDREAVLKKAQDDSEITERELQVLQQVKEVLSAITGKCFSSATKRIEGLVNKGLSEVFDDQNLVFSIRASVSRKKSFVSFHLREGSTGEDLPLISSYGGGVLSVIAILLRITTIHLLEKRKVLILDESLSQVSDEYIENLSAFLNNLCENSDFIILLVTHQRKFTTYASEHYRMVKGSNSTTLERVT